MIDHTVCGTSYKSLGSDVSSLSITAVGTDPKSRHDLAFDSPKFHYTCYYERYDFSYSYFKYLTYIYELPDIGYMIHLKSPDFYSSLFASIRFEQKTCWKPVSVYHYMHISNSMIPLKLNQN